MHPRGEDFSGGFQLPPLAPWMRNLLGGLFGLYLLELVAFNFLSVQVYSLLAWAPVEQGFAPWQILTHYLVQGPGTGGAIGVLLGLLVLWFFLPVTVDLVDRGRLIRALLVGAAGGIALGLLADLLPGRLQGGALGWSLFPMILVLLFGLRLPDAEIRLFMVLPILGRWIVWGTLGISALFVIAEPSIGTFEHLGAAGAVVGWWNLRRRKLVTRQEEIKEELRRFQVIEGGARDDDLVN